MFRLETSSIRFFSRRNPNDPGVTFLELFTPFRHTTGTLPPINCAPVEWGSPHYLLTDMDNLVLFHCTGLLVLSQQEAMPSVEQGIKAVIKTLVVYYPDMLGFCSTITSRARQARGGSFKRAKDYTPKKEFVYRMCAGQPTSAMPKPQQQQQQPQPQPQRRRQLLHVRPNPFMNQKNTNSNNLFAGIG